MNRHSHLSLIGLSSQDGSLALSGTPSHLQDLANILRTSSEPFEIELKKINQIDPYDVSLDMLQIQPTSGQLLKVSREKNVLSISGSREALSVFADNIQFLVEKGVEHIHVDYHPDHPFLDPSSEPIVISSEIPP